MIGFEHVTKRFADGTVAVDDLSLEIPTGSVLALVGSSGSGKTTTLRMINRMVEPTSGVVSIDGRDVTTLDVHELRRGIGYVIQQIGLFPHRRVIDNITTVPRLIGWDRRRARARAMELLEMVGLDASLARRYPAQLSGGQQQRVGVARALAADPPVLLMDEPFGALDPIARAQLQREFVQLQRRIATTTVFVTHDLDEALLVGDRVAVLREGGTLAQVDTPRALLGAPADEFVRAFLGDQRAVRLLGIVRVGELEAVPLDAAPEGFRLEGTVWRRGDVSEVAGVVTDDATGAQALDAALASVAGAVVVTDPDGAPRGIITLEQLRAPRVPGS